MMRATGCDGVVVGRGCLGRPWLFRDLADVFDGRAPQDPPSFGEVADIMLEHARLLAALVRRGRTACAASASTRPGTRRASATARRCACGCARSGASPSSSRSSPGIDRDEPFSPLAMRVPRGKSGGTQKVALPDGYLENLDDDTPPGAEAEDPTSGGLRLRASCVSPARGRRTCGPTCQASHRPRRSRLRDAGTPRPTVRIRRRGSLRDRARARARRALDRLRGARSRDRRGGRAEAA